MTTPANSPLVVADWLTAGKPPTRQRLVLPLPPPLNRLYHNWRGRMVMSNEGKAWKLAAGLKAKAHYKAAPDELPVTVSVSVFRRRKAGDIDGYLKLTLDALQGYAYINDSQVDRLMVSRFDDATNPRIEVTTWET